jgi:hypothetical protein
MVARRFSALSYAFNRAGLKVHRHNVVQAELCWDDVDKVVIGMPIVIRTKDGSAFKLPMALLVSERYENRALNRKLHRLQPPERIPPLKSWVWFGGISFLVGLPIFLLAKQPWQVYGESDGRGGAVWIGLVPVILGAVLLVVGILLFGFGSVFLSAIRSPHPYVINQAGIRRGKRFIPWGEIDRITRWVQASTASNHRVIEKCDRLLGDYLMVVREDETDGRKKLEFPDGSVPSRMTPPRVAVEDAEAFIAWAEANGKSEWVRVKREADIATIKKVADYQGDQVIDPITGTVVEGLSHTEGGVSITVKVAE